MDTYYTGPDGTIWAVDQYEHHAPTERATLIEVHDALATSGEVGGFTPYYTSLSDIITDIAYSPTPYETAANEVRRALERAVLEEVNDQLQDFCDDDIKSESLEEWIKSLKVEAVNE